MLRLHRRFPPTPSSALARLTSKGNLFFSSSSSSLSIMYHYQQKRHASSSSSTSAEPGPCLIPGYSPPLPRIDSLRPYLRELAVRSASAREAIREAVRSPSVELGLRHFDDFLNMYEFSQNDINRLYESHDIDRLRIVLNLFKVWYMNIKAPAVVNMNEPWTWFSKARMMRRRFIFHQGPTNSGKTHLALQALMKAKSGVYCAPLKALASQVWMQMNEKIGCDLLIGDERNFAGSAEHVSCTVEMTPIELGCDVAVIDEVQLIEDPERGWAWTRALLGLPAREIHLCGEPRAIPLIKRILWNTKEAGRLQIVNHQRLVPLDVENESLKGRLDAAKAGDCFVCFSRKQVFETAKTLKDRLGTSKNAKVHVVYGGLPFAVRERSSQAFNEGAEKGEFHVLVSTDAIAYGLNLSIRRIIFSTMRKFDGTSMKTLSSSSILQIAGRAGRYGRKFSDHGYATTLHDRDFNLLQSTMQKGAHSLPPLERAGILPTADVLAIFAETVPHLTFEDMIKEFNDTCSVNNDTFFVCNMARSLIAIAEVISDVEMMTCSQTQQQYSSISSSSSSNGVADKIMFCFAPMGSGDQDGLQFLRRLCIEHGRGGPVKLEIDGEVKDVLKVKLERLLGVSSSSTTSSSQDKTEREEVPSLNFDGDEEQFIASTEFLSNKEFVSVIQDFYQQFNPEKISDVSSLCEKYPDRSKIINGLKAKYKVKSIVVNDNQKDLIRSSIENNPARFLSLMKQNGNNNNKFLDHSQQQELQNTLRRMETLYRWVEVYGWLAWRFPKTFSDLELSASVKSELVQLINMAIRAQIQNE